MKYGKLTILFLTMVATLSVFGVAKSQTNPLLNFTGKITNTDGSELADGNYDMTYTLYDAPTGGSAVWTETLDAANRFSGTISAATTTILGVEYAFASSSATSTLRSGQYLTASSSGSAALIIDFTDTSVTVASGSPVWPAGTGINNRPFVEGGVINENLGTVSGFGAVDFSIPLYLEVEFNGETMQPRKLMDTAAQAFDAINFGGRTASQYAVLDEDETITGSWSFNNAVSIATGSASTALTVTQSGNGNIVDFVGTSSSVSVLTDGRLQIGDYILPADSTGASAGYVLKIDAGGNMYWDTDFAGSGGGSGLWASGTDATYGSFVFQSDTGDDVIIGNNTLTGPASTKFEVHGLSWFDTLGISNQQQLRFYESGSGNYMAIRATSTLGADLVLTLPADAGADGLALVTDGSGNLRWDSPTSFVYVNAGNAGQLAYYGSSGSVLSGTSTLFLSPAGGLGIGTTTISGLFAVGTNLGSQFLIDDSGRVVGGTWQGGVISTAYGGTGTSTWQANSLVFAPADDTLSQILPGPNGYVLKMSGGVPTWEVDSTVGGESILWSTSSDELLIRPTNVSHVVLIGAGATSTDMGQILEVAGDSYFTGAINADSLSLVNALSVGSGGTGSTSPSGILLGDGAGNIASLPNNSANWNTAFSWGDHSLENYFSTSSGRVLEIAYGGTGTSTWQANSLVFAPADDTLSQILPGPNGWALVMQGGIPVWASTSPGTTHDLLSSMHPDTTPDTVARGDLITGQGAGATWSKLALGADGFILRSNGTDAVWSTTTAITALGTISSGAWEAQIISEQFGGTGQAGWNTGDIVFATSSDNLDALAIGGAGYILQAVNGRPSWVATSSLGIDFNGIGGTLGADSGGTGADSSGWNGIVRVVGGSWGVVNGSAGQAAYWSDANTIAGENQLALSRGGTGQDFSGDTGFIYTDSGTMTASATIAITLTDLADDNSGVELSGNILSLDTSGNWSGTFDNQEGSYYLNAVNLNNFNIPFSGALAGTTTDALSEGSGNLYWTQNRFAAAFDATTTDALREGSLNYYWTDSRFDVRLTGTSSIATLTGLPNLQTVGTITSGTWQGDAIAVSQGGTGLSSYTANSLLYASGAGTIGQITPGTNGLVLKMSGGVPGWYDDLTSGGEVMPWSTSSDSLLIYPDNITDIVLIGATATSASDTIFEVAGNALFTGSISANSLSLTSALAVGYGGTGSSSPSGILLGDGAGNIASLPNNSADWNQAYAWGDHSTENYFSTTTDILEIAYGGTGQTAWSANSLVYASSENVLGEIAIGTEGYALVVQGGIPTWSSTTPGTAHGILSSQHSDVEATSTLERGDLIVGGASSQWTRLALGADGYILRAVGSDPVWVPTTGITELGTITTGAWNADTIGLAYGGTGADTAAGARANLGLDDVYEFGVNSTGTVGWLWQSDGVGRGRWVATGTLGLGGSGGGSGDSNSVFVGTTSVEYDGSFATGTLSGYAAANAICDYEYPGSHFCRTYDLLVTVETGDISSWSGRSWVAEGPPGFTSSSNDCNGWTTNDSGSLGAWWNFNPNGGAGYLIYCDYTRPLACCSRN